MRRWAILVAWLAVQAAWTCHALAADLPLDFARQYGPAVERIRQAYTHATLSGTLRQEYPSTGKGVEQTFTYRVSGTRIRLDITTDAARKSKAKIGATKLLMATDIGSLETFRNPGEKVFHDAKELKYAGTKSRIETMCHVTDVFAIGDRGTIFEFLRQPSVTDVQIKNITRQGETLVKVGYEEVSGRLDKQVHWKSYFVFSPSEGWAVREYSRSTGSGDQEVIYRGALEYSGNLGGVPVLTRLQYVEEHGPKRTVVVKESVNIDKFTPGDPSEQYFTAFDF